jgi:hypothetical protein
MCSRVAGRFRKVAGHATGRPGVTRWPERSLWMDTLGDPKGTNAPRVRHRSARDQHHSHARDRRGSGRELGPPRDADGNGAGGLHALAGIPALRPGRPDLAEPRPVRAQRGPCVDAALQPAPSRAGQGGQSLWGKEIRFRQGGSARDRFRLGVVLVCLLYRFLCGVVGVLARGGGERALEIVVLRHQLAILGRGGKRRRYTTVDRALLAAAGRLLPPERWSCFGVCPRTLRRWHREQLEEGRRGRRRRPGRPPLAAETRGLIERMARENARWGYMRIEGELLKLGISVSATTIATVLRRSGLGPAPRRLGPSWSEFLRAQAYGLLGSELRSSVGAGREDDASVRAGPHPMGRPARWKPTTRSPRSMLMSLAWFLARWHVRGRSAPPRRCVLSTIGGPSAGGDRIDRTPATDPHGRPALARNQRFWHPRSRRRVALASGRTSSASSRSASGLFTHTVSAQWIDHCPSWQPEPNFFTPHA